MRLLPTLGIVLILAACGGSSDGAGSERLSEPLEQAAVAFEDGPSALAIKNRLDQAFGHFGLAETDENYSRAASSLIALRQSAFGQGCDACTEMAILSHMLRSDGWEVGMDFPEAAAWSQAAMLAGDQ